jgi:hypothetical protein
VEISLLVPHDRRRERNYFVPKSSVSGVVQPIDPMKGVSVDVTNGRESFVLRGFLKAPATSL